MYAHDKNKKFASFLKQKVKESEIEQIIDSLPDAIQRKELKKVRVFDTEMMEKIEGESGRNSNSRKNHRQLLNLLGETNGYLPLVELPDSIFDDLDALSKRFPNFGPVIEFFKQEFALAKITNDPYFATQPLLIAGPSGVGKTIFCHEIAKLVNTHFEFISMSSMTAGFVLSGNSSGWAEGKYGKVVLSFAQGQRANPLLLIDEIDKVGGDTRYDPLGSLYSLLEKETARKFVDEALEVPVDCSHAVWVATANYLDRIPEPIVSRFTIIEVASPSTEQMAMVLSSIYSKVRQNHQWGTIFQNELSQSVVNQLVKSGLEPRLLQKALVSGCGRAVLRKSLNSELLQDKLELTIEDLMLTKFVEKPKFLQKSNSYQEDTKERDVVIMPIFNMPGISNEQRLEEIMTLWSVHEVDDGEYKSHHLVGYIPTRQTGRVTSPIKQFQKEFMRVITSSGRKYKLEGPPALNSETKFVWAEWKEKYNIQNDTEVTHQYFTTH